MPNRKTMAAGFAGAVSVLVVYLLGLVPHLEMPPAIASVVTTIVHDLVAYFVPEGPDSQPSIAAQQQNRNS